MRQYRVVRAQKRGGRTIGGWITYYRIWTWVGNNPQNGDYLFQTRSALPLAEKLVKQLQQADRLEELRKDVE